MRSFVKIKSLQNGEITLLFTDIGKSYPSFLALQIRLLTLFAKINFQIYSMQIFYLLTFICHVNRFLCHQQYMFRMHILRYIIET